MWRSKLPQKLAETGAAAGEAGGVGTLEVLGGTVGAVVAPEVAIPAAIGLAAGAGGALVAGVGRSEAEHLKEQELALPPSQRPQLGQSWRGRCGRAWGRNVWGLGFGAVGGAYEGARYMFMLGGNAGDGSWSDQAPDRTLNNMQQGAPQQQISLRQRAAASSAADGV